MYSSSPSVLLDFQYYMNRIATKGSFGQFFDEPSKKFAKVTSLPSYFLFPQHLISAREITQNLRLLGNELTTLAL